MSCVWPSPERQLLIDFFEACRVYDATAMAQISTVSCNPRVDGVVERFEMIGVERPRPEERQVVLRAWVRLFGSEAAERIVHVAIQRRDGAWKVTALRPLPASRTSPAASSAPPS